ncbi:hypothetical protein LX16_2604 [Stackebrandtia albiflava]|uniref:Uncharacterized protein n=1 Tax=Stackebrandtia albiflava TaxID=406432 RepID=A0A562V233_9ACTN|nr:hypothetical protein [Stackebrandtia albiflava]TWJ11867.1 hypothetical protein LX16_2604 [Stackebrandtia albiflava]
MKMFDRIRKTADNALDAVIRQGSAAARECDCVRVSGGWQKRCVINGRIVVIGTYPTQSRCLTA